MISHDAPPDTPAWLLHDPIARKMLREGRSLDDVYEHVERLAIVEYATKEIEEENP